jgi:hypothetical protein
MKDDQDDPALEGRPADCQAKSIGDYAGCERCGLAWRLDAGAAAPSCAPMTVKRFRFALLREIGGHMGSHSLTREAAARGLPADPAAPLAAAMELSAIHNLVDRCLTNRRIVDILQGKQKEQFDNDR